MKALLWIIFSVMMLLIAPDWMGVFAAESGKPGVKPKTADELETVEMIEEDKLALGGEDSPRDTIRAIGTFSESQEEARTTIVGTITLEDGRSFPVKLRDAVLLEQLKRFKRGRVRIAGELRNKGKYLVIGEVSDPTPAPPPPGRKKSRGL